MISTAPTLSHIPGLLQETPNYPVTTMTNYMFMFAFENHGFQILIIVYLIENCLAEI
jgi:hypothetical protein